MQFVASTPIAIAAILLLLALGPRRGAWVFFALLPFGAAAAFNLPALGGASIITADLAALAMVVLILLTPGAGSSMFGTMRPWQPGFFLTLVILVSAFSAIFAPRVFAGLTEVFSIARDESHALIVKSPLGPSSGNITQLFRLILGYLTFIGFATAFRRTPQARSLVVAMIVATSVHFAMGWIDVITFAAGADQLLDFIRTANYTIRVTDTMAGFKRMIGGFPEASSFGFFSLGLFGFWLQYWLIRPRSRAAPWMLAMASVAVLRSTSSSAYLALIVFLFGFALFNFFRFLRPEAERRSVAVAVTGALLLWVAAAGVTAGYQMAEPVTAFFDDILFDKMESDSGVERMSWNTQALTNFTDTWWLGAGLGSVRASNWVISCLGSIGLPGTLLFIAFLTAFLLAPAGEAGRASSERAASIRGAKAGVLAMLSSAVLTHSTPDLGLFVFALAGAATGLSRAGVMESLAHRPRPGVSRS
ncbi:MAG: hypothetical protein CSA74_09425 [Rhodobacterales bacterium]|nr:MAG: hypothetical protein CSA74_09425 [Rhodobacterales bacterium]